MNNLPSNMTNPVVIEATGYSPYAEKRAKKAAMMGKKDKYARSAAAAQDFWIQEKFKKSVEDYVYHHSKDLFRSQWECVADKRGLQSRVRYEMNKIYDMRNALLQERRQRLRELLEAELRMFVEEEKRNVLTPDQQQANMRQRYNTIISMKEAERQKLAEKKKQQHFRLNCDELRTKVSKQICELVTAEGKSLAEAKLKQMLDFEKRDEMYDKAWASDVKAKDEKVTEMEKQQKMRNMATSEHYMDIMRGLNLPSYDTPAHEATIREELNRLMEIEKDWEKMQKMLNRERIKHDLDKCLKDKLAIKAQDVQQDLALDLHFLKQLKFGADVEKDKQQEKKAALKQNQDNYVRYLRNQIAAEGEFEKNLDKKFKMENDKMWEKKEAQWEKERNMREARNKKLIEDHKEQIRNKMERCKEMEQMKIKYDEEIRKQAEFDSMEERDKRMSKREANLKNQQELLDQIKERDMLAKEALIQKEKDNYDLKKERSDLMHKIDQLLSESSTEHLHPKRKDKSGCCG